MMFSKKKEAPKEPDGNEALSKLILELPNAIQESVASGMSTALKGFKPQQAAPPKKDEPAPKVEPLVPEGTNLDDLSNGDMLNLMFKGMDQKLGELTAKLDPQFQKLSDDAQITSIQSQVKELSKDNPDFFKYREAMAAVAKQYPNLSPKDIYDLARVQAPEITEQIAKDKKEADSEDKTNVVDFGGLLPTSGQSSEATEGMNFEDAAEKAWNDTMSEVPDNIIGGSNN